MAMDWLRKLLIKHEGLCLKPYTDTVGKLTIGVGRNLSDNGITENEALVLLENDIHIAKKSADLYPWFLSLNEPRQAVILSMLINMGANKFSTFKKMIAAIEASNFDKAASEMLMSKWASQVKSRAVELADIMRLGRFNGQ